MSIKQRLEDFKSVCVCVGAEKQTNEELEQPLQMPNLVFQSGS